LIHLLENVADIIDGISKDATSINHNEYIKATFHIISRRNITITNCHHGNNGKIKRINISK